MHSPKYPTLYQINTRVWLKEWSQQLGRQATLDDIPDQTLDEFVDMGFDWIWLLSVWTTGEKGRIISRANKEWRREFEDTLPDLQEEDIGGSGFAIADYSVLPTLGGGEGLKRFRNRLNKRGIKMMLDFVPNHMGPDHPWIREHPEYFVAGTPVDLKRYPRNYTQFSTVQGDVILAHGRDPNFAGWPDTVQLDYSNPDTIKAMTELLIHISSHCDGMRCDMAMVILPEVFERTWGRKALPFWPGAIKAVKEKYPGFCFLAEVYWDMEWILQQQGFDYTYDKRLYDRLRDGYAKDVREHFYAGLGYQDKMVRFLENHDELRAAATFELKKHKAAAIISFFSPGMQFFHQGQLEGRKKRISPHLVRAPEEPVNAEVYDFYQRLLGILKKPVFRDGTWQLLECKPAWEGNETWNGFVACSWMGNEAEINIIIINYSPHQSQCFLLLPFPQLPGKLWHLQDLMHDISYDRPGDEMISKGLYLDMEGYMFHVFRMTGI